MRALILFLSLILAQPLRAQVTFFVSGVEKYAHEFKDASFQWIPSGSVDEDYGVYQINADYTTLTIFSSPPYDHERYAITSWEESLGPNGLLLYFDVAYKNGETNLMWDIGGGFLWWDDGKYWGEKHFLELVVDKPFTLWLSGGEDYEAEIDLSSVRQKSKFDFSTRLEFRQDLTSYTGYNENGEFTNQINRIGQIYEPGLGGRMIIFEIRSFHGKQYLVYWDREGRSWWSSGEKTGVKDGIPVYDNDFRRYNISSSSL